MTVDLNRILISRCRLLELNLSAAEALESESSEAEIELRNDFNVIGAEGNSITVRYSLSMRPNEGAYYSANMVALAEFVFPEESEDQEKDVYLKTIGLLRMYDWSRAVLENASTAGILGPLSLPPNPPHLIAAEQ